MQTHPLQKTNTDSFLNSFLEVFARSTSEQLFKRYIYFSEILFLFYFWELLALATLVSSSVIVEDSLLLRFIFKKD